MAGSARRAGRYEAPSEAAETLEMEETLEMVATALEQAVHETLAERSHSPARTTIEALIRFDEEFEAEGEPPPGWTLAFLALSRWLKVLRVALTDRPERVEEALSWIETNLGRRYRARARYTVGPLQTDGGGGELAHYVDALGTDFLPSMLWIVAAVVELYGEGDACWPRRLADQADQVASAGAESR